MPVGPIIIDTSVYRRSHMKEPSGRGRWAFGFSPYAQGADVIFTPMAMDFKEAMVWAKNEAKNRGMRTIYVMP